MTRHKMHYPGPEGPLCGESPFTFPQGFALTTDQSVTCTACLLCLSLSPDAVEQHGPPTQQQTDRNQVDAGGDTQGGEKEAQQAKHEHDDDQRSHARVIPDHPGW